MTDVFPYFYLSGEVEHESGVPALCVGGQQGDGALGGGHDLPAHGQAESRPLAFGGEEGGEHVGAFRFRDGGPVVADLNHHVVVCRAVGFAGDVPRPVADGLRRIADQVEQHLAYQLLVGIEHEVGGAGVAIPCDVWRHEGQGLDFHE